VIGVGIALLLVVGVPAFGYYREVLTKGARAIATVEGETISLDTFSKLYGYRLINLESQMQQMQMMQAQSQGGGNVFQQQIQRLQAERTNLDTTVLNELVEQKLIAKEANLRDVAVTRADEDARIEREFGVAPLPTPTTGPDAPAVALQPAPTVNAQERMRNTVADRLKFMTEAEFRALVIRPALVSERLQDTFMAQVPPSELQVHARHLLLSTEEEARAAKVRIDKGETIDQLAPELSKDAATKDSGGDLGWFGRGRMTKPFEDVAFGIPVNLVSDPVRTAHGWHLIQVTEKDANRQLDEAARNEKRSALFRNWMEKRKEDGFGDDSIEYQFSTEKVTWARGQVNVALGRPRNAQ